MLTTTALLFEFILVSSLHWLIFFLNSWGFIGSLPIHLGFSLVLNYSVVIILAGTAEPYRVAQPEAEV